MNTYLLQISKLFKVMHLRKNIIITDLLSFSKGFKHLYPNQQPSSSRNNYSHIAPRQV